MNSNPSTVILGGFVAGVANGFATSQAVAGPGNLTLNGSLVSSGVGVADRARRVVLASSNAGDTTQTATITGTNAQGTIIKEVVPLNGTTPVVSAQDFATVTQIAMSAATAGTMTAGTSSGGATTPIGSSLWQVDNFLAVFWGLAGGITGPAGTTYTLECTYDDPNKLGTSLVVSPQQWSMNPASFVPPHVYPHPTIANVSGDNQFDYANHPIFAHRLTINSGTGQVVMQTIQSGPWG